MRPIPRIQRPNQAPCPVDEAFDTRPIIHMPGDHNVQTMAERDEAAIEHPVHSAGQRHTVKHLVGPIGPHRTDMRCLDLGTPSAIDKSQTGNAAALIIRL